MKSVNIKKYFGIEVSLSSYKYTLVLSFVSLTLLVLSCLPVITFFLALLICLALVVRENRKLILLSFLVGSVVAILFYFYWDVFYGRPYFLGALSDDYHFDNVWSHGFTEKYGLRMSKVPAHLNSIEPGLGIMHNSRAYVYLIIVLRYIGDILGGYHSLMPRLLNIFLLALLANYCSQIVFNNTHNGRARKIAFLAVFFFPVLLFNAAHIFRDTLIAFLLVWIYYTITNPYNALIAVLKVSVALSILFYLRTTTFFMSLLMIVLLLTRVRRVSIKLVFVIVLFMIVAYFLLNSFILEALMKIEGYQELNTQRFGSIGTLTFRIPLKHGFLSRILFVWLSPVLSLSSLHQFYVSISSILQILFLPFILASFKLRYIDLRLKLVFTMFFLGVALTSADFRHVSMFLPFGIILAVLGYFRFNNGVFFRNSYIPSFLIFILVVMSNMLFIFTY